MYLLLHFCLITYYNICLHIVHSVAGIGGNLNSQCGTVTQMAEQLRLNELVKKSR